MGLIKGLQHTKCKKPTEIKKSTVTIGDFNTPFSVTDRAIRQKKISRKTEEVK